MLKLNKNYIFNGKQLSLKRPPALKNSTNSISKIEWKNARPYKEIPSISKWTIMKNMLPGGRYSKLDITQMWNMLHKQLGSIGLIKGILGQPDTVLCHNPKDFENIFRNEGLWPNRPGPSGIRYHRSVHRKDFFEGNEGLITTYGEDWGKFRSAVNPVLMNPKNIKIYLKRMSDVNREFVERTRQIRDPQTLEVPDTYEDDINRWTFESVCVVALDKQLGLILQNRDDPKLRQLLQAMNDFFAHSMKLEYSYPIWKYYKTKSFRKIMYALDQVVDITSSYVQEAIDRIDLERKREGIAMKKSESEQSVLEKLIKLDKKTATVMAMDMLMAGVDTTSSTFVGLLLCLAKNPKAQQKLRKEILQILPHKESEFNADSVNNMPYLRACIKESLRYYPLVSENGRVIANDLVLSGYRVPKGTQVSMISTSLMHNDMYFPRANEYLPERWLRTTETIGEQKKHIDCPHQSLKASHNFVYLPFGFGARSCVGKRIVQMELELGIARFVRNFDIEFNHPLDKPFKSLLINVPAIPLKFKFKDLNY